MIRRWNLTIILIVTAFVLGVVAGYVYRDRFSWLLLDTDELERTEPNISEKIFRTEIENILRPETANEAVTEPAEVYSFTGRIIAISSTAITVEQPSDATETLDAIDFILTNATRYAELQTFINEYGLPDSSETALNSTDLAVGDLVSVYTEEDIRTAPERRVIAVHKLNNE